MAGPDASILRRWDSSGVPLLLARLVLGGLFIWMGVAKIADPVAFLKVVRQYNIVTVPLILNGTAIALPWIEIVAGLAMILGLFTRGAAATMAIMLLVFTPAILARTFSIMGETGASFFDVKFDCGCGGGEVIIWKKTLENAGLLLLSLLALFSRTRRFSLDLVLARRSPDSGWCHFCGYAVRTPITGLCEDCATPPAIPGASPSTRRALS